MKQFLLKTAVVIRFAATSPDSVTRQTKKMLKEYLQLSQGMGEIAGSTPVQVRKMLGVDEDMREWSFFEILRHNTIVSNFISGNVRRLALKEPAPTRRFSVKQDVMPEADCNVEQIALFKAAILGHLNIVEELGDLKSTDTSMHPLFGPLNAHGWNCMFAFHLEIHLKQAIAVRNAVLGPEF